MRKLHLLTYEVPGKALFQRSVGLEAEHCSESINLFVNQWQRVYCTLQDPKAPKAQWLSSEPIIKHLCKSKQRICPKCAKPSHNK